MADTSQEALRNDPLLEGLSHEPLIEEMAKWVVDESVQLGYEPDLSDLVDAMEQRYGVSREQTMQAIAEAISRGHREQYIKDFHGEA